MVYIIIKKSERELRERAAEAPAAYRGQISAYSRGHEESYDLLTQMGRDNPNVKPILTDDGGDAERELRHRSLRAFGINNVEAYD